MLNLELLFSRVGDYLPNFNRQRIQSAYNFANVHQKDIDFSFKILDVLLDLKPDENSIIACFFITLWNKREFNKDDILNNFGADVVELLRNLDKVNAIKVNFSQEEQIDNLRKLFLVMARDIRVVLIQLAYRLAILRQIDSFEIADKHFFVKEILHIYSPIASRLGIYNFKIELENLAFKFLHPQKFSSLTKELATYIKKRRESIDGLKKIIENILSKEGIKARIKGRVKHPYSIYQKLNKKQKLSLDKIFDIFALRIILPDKLESVKETVGHCYEVLGIIHKYFSPVPNKFKDYIAVPKSNGYRSLHTTVLGVGEGSKDQPTEIQIRTESMHKESEYGISSHWCYEDLKKTVPKMPQIQWKTVLENQEKFQLIENLMEDSLEFRSIVDGWKSNKGTLDDDYLLSNFKISKEDIERFLSAKIKQVERNYPLYRQITWLKGLIKLQEEIKSSAELNDNLQVNIFKDRIFVLTPGGEVKDLPVGSTPVDFAYAVHTEVGHSCYQAKVNGEIVPLNYALKNGQIVEIISKKNKEPNRYWLSFVKTHFAKAKIKAWFREQDQDANIKEGKLLINSELARLGKALLTPNLDLLRGYNGKRLNRREREEVLENVGGGIISVNTVLKNLFSPRELVVGRVQRKIKTVTAPPSNEEEILVIGESGLPIKKGSCCKPKFDDEIIGYVTRGKGISIHNKACSMLKSLEQDRLLPAEWTKKSQSLKYTVKLSLKTDIGEGVISGIVRALSEMNVNILQFYSDSEEESEKFFEIVLEVLNRKEIENVLNGLEKVAGVLSVKKSG